ncbi:TPA_asm: P [Panicum betacytorhabdovirus 1]|nr:TPA_asm: P [Panicum betacytorhabdovirus 1]
MAEAALFGDIGEDVIPGSFDLDDDEIDYSPSGGGAGPSQGRVEVETGPDNAGNDGFFVDSEDMYPDISSALKGLATKLSDHGITMRKEWSTVISRRFNVTGPLYPSHIDMFVLGIQAERNVGLNSDLKETSKRIQEEANHICGERKKMKDASEKIISDFERMMKDMNTQLQELSSAAENLKTASREASEVGSIADALETTRPRTVQDLLSDLGFQEKSITHPVMVEHIDKVAPQSFVNRYFKNHSKQNKERVKDYILEEIKKHKIAAEEARKEKGKSVLV